MNITAGGTSVLSQGIGDTSQDDRFEKSDNWYTLDVEVPFVKKDLTADGGITLGTGGERAWLPRHLYMFGLDMAEGHPTEIVPLVSVTNWNMGWLSEDTREGQPSSFHLAVFFYILCVFFFKLCIKCSMCCWMSLVLIAYSLSWCLII